MKAPMEASSYSYQPWGGLRDDPANMCPHWPRRTGFAPAKGASPHQLWTAFENDAQIVSWH
jgi:hypothetical protein